MSVNHESRREIGDGLQVTGDRKKLFHSSLVTRHLSRVALFFFLFTFHFSLFTLFSTPSHAETTEIIKSIAIENQIPERQADIRALIRMKEGEPFDREKMENAIYDLRKWGIFKNVEVLVKHQGNEVSLTFQLEDAYILRDIEIHGNYPLLEKKVKRAIFFSTGDVFSAEKIPEQVDRLITFYEKEGYKDTVVFIEVSKDEEHRMVTLNIKIQKGKTYRLGEITVKGNTVFWDSRIKNKLFSFFGYSPNKVKKSLEKIDKLYQSHGYPRIRAKVTETHFDDAKHKVDLTIEIREGKKVEVAFEGNDHQFARSLKKVVSVAENGDTDEFELDHSKNELIAHYQSLGYEDVQVEVEKKDVSEKEILITFKINEGEKRVIKAIDFEGNHAYSDKTLRKQMLTKKESISDRGVFLKPLFDQDLETITSFYQKDGYLEAKIEDWKRSLIATNDKYLIDIDLTEGKQTLVDSVSFEGLTLFKPDEIKKFLLVKDHLPYSPSRLEEDARALLVYYSNHAHPYTEVKTEIEEVGPQKVKIKYKIKEGPKTKVGKILLVGSVVTKRKTILQALQFKEGGPFIPEQILKSQTNLRKLGIFDALTIETLGLKGKEEVIHVVVRVEEKKRKVIDLGLTYDTDTSFKAKLTLQRLNLGGWGKRMDLKLTGGVQLNRAELAYIDPRFLGSDWSFLSNIFAQYESRPFFTDFQAGGSLAYLRELTHRLSFLIKYELSRTDFVESKTDFNLLQPGSADNTTGKLGFTVTYDRRDNYGDPHRGYFVLGRTDFGTSFSGGGLANFIKLGTKLGYWYSPFERLTIANAFRMEGIIQVSGANIPTQELIFIGGDDTIRGFHQDALNPNGGTLGFIYNFELQFRLFKGFEMVGFVDTASLTNSFSEINFGTIRHTAGGGIRYVTPVGPIRLEYGVILDRQPNDNFGQLVFTFGYFF